MLAALAVGHLAFSVLATVFDDVAASADVPWFATGFAIVAMTRFSGRMTLAGAAIVFVSGLFAHRLAGVSLAEAGPLALVGVVEVLAGLVLLSTQNHPDEDRTPVQWVRIVGLVGIVVPAAGSMLAALVVGRFQSADGMTLVLGRWVAESTGTLIVLSIGELRNRLRRRGRFRVEAMLEAAAHLSLSLAIVWVSVATASDLLPVAVMPLVVAGLRLPGPCASICSLIMLFAVAAARWASGNVIAMSEATLFLATSALLATVPVALSLLRADLERERNRIAASERHFRDAMQKSPFGMALLDTHGVCFSVNRALCELLDYAPDELIGLRSADITVGESPDAVDDRFARLARGEIAEFSLEKQFRKKDGSPVWVFVAVSLVRDETSGRALYLIAQMNDIEARRRTEQELELSESRWNFALESAGQGVWDYDYRRRDTFYSPMWSRMLGYEPGELSCEGDAWLALIHPHDLPHLLREEHRHLVGETEQFECEFRMRHKDGGWLWILDRGKVIARDANGRPQRMIGTHTDITENRRLTEALQNEKERLRITLHSIGDGVICTDAQGLVTFINPIAEGLTGWSASLALGRPCSSVFQVVRDDDEVAPCPITRTLASRERIADKDGIILIGRTGARIDVEASASPVCKANGELLGAVLVFQDVTRSRTLQKELAQLATHDALTGLRNRSAFEHTLTEYCNDAAGEDAVHALCFLDLDRFKIINDTAGHAAGDALLREVGRLIREQMRRHDVVARLGGDEFGVLLVDCDIDDARTIAERLIEKIGRIRFSWAGRVYEVGASVGIARLDAETPLAADVMSRADVACYAAKAAGRNRVSVYHVSEGDARRHHAELHTAAGIRAALDTDRFEIYAQEIRDLRPSGHLHRHAELLVRMIDDDGRLLPPGAFIPAAERYGLMGSIDRWMIRRVLHHLDRAILAVPRLALSINLSANSLDDPGLLAFLAEALESSALPPHRLRFEITETSLINNITHAGRLVEDLRAAGYAIMLDDFGAGLSSFAYLEQFPADYIKIDGSFVRKLTGNPVDRAIVESINDIGHKIGAVTIAEFVEDETTLTELARIGVDMAQGYHIARPEPLADLLARLAPEGPAARSVG